MRFGGLKDGAKTSSMLFAIIFPIVFSIVSAGCNSPAGRELVLNDFEADSDLDRIHWQCRTLFSLSDQHATSGQRSLKMELYPAAYPGVALKLGKGDWSRYGAVAFDIYNPRGESLDMAVRIDDRADYPDFGDRYNGRLTLLPGGNRLRIPLASLRASGTGRPLDLKTIKRFLIFLVDTHETYSLYLDSIRLEA